MDMKPKFNSDLRENFVDTFVTLSQYLSFPFHHNLFLILFLSSCNVCNNNAIYLISTEIKFLIQLALRLDFLECIFALLSSFSHTLTLRNRYYANVRERHA